MHIDQQQRLEMVGQVASGIAHDLNNQMMLILNHLELALGRVSADDELYRDLSDVRSAAERCTEMIGSLLTFGIPSRVQFAPVDLTTLLAETGRLLRRAIPNTIDLVVATEQAGGDGGCEVDGDATQIQQVVMNLAMNARAAMPNGGKLRIQACCAEGQVSLTVSDTGCGMTPELQSRIFEPYFTTRGESGGTGLGLAMVAGILRRHGAQVSVESSVEKGSSFRITFPCRKAVPQNG